jgi:hypothetical protein
MNPRKVTQTFSFTKTKEKQMPEVPVPEGKPDEIHAVVFNMAGVYYAKGFRQFPDALLQIQQFGQAGKPGSMFLLVATFEGENCAEVIRHQIAHEIHMAFVLRRLTDIGILN